MNIAIERAQTPEALEHIRALFQEYADTRDVDLRAVNFEQELAELPGKYAPPTGALFLATVDNQPAGSIALRRFEDGICEGKRLYVRPQFRRFGLGRTMIERLVQEARTIGYQAMRLDTIPAQMQSAVALYESFGFKRIPAYWNNPFEGVEYMELKL